MQPDTPEYCGCIELAERLQADRESREGGEE
jgi:hypothetical protein